MNKLICILLLLSSAFSADISVDEIINKANQVAYYSGDDGRAKVSMVIKDSQGRKRKRSFVILRKKSDSEADASQKFYIYFNRPSDLKDMTFLVWKQTKGDDDRWLYLPSLDLVKRIAGSDKRTSFVGSTFFYEDISGRGINDDTHTLLKTEGDYYIVENTPKNPKDVEFSKYIAWIHKESFVPARMLYYDENGKEYREYNALKVENIDGFETTTLQQMKDLETGTTTLIKYTNVEYNIGLDEAVFTERYLKNPPTALLKFEPKK